MRTQLERIAESAVLRNSARLQRLLRHIVEATLSGEAERLKGYTLGLAVFDRRADFDPNIDPVVRVEVGRLRSKLVEYYAGEGAYDEVRIELPKGRYAAHVVFRSERSIGRRSYSVGSSLPGSDDLLARPSLETLSNNLPPQITSFVGRDYERGEVKRLLGQRRLVTLVGIGGIGKTRLSLQVAADMLGTYPDGVWLAELGAMTDSSLVATAVAQAVGVQEPPQASLTKTLCTHLQSRRLLLVLDNCEHLIDACANLVGALLAAAPELRILATSREPLRVGGEQVFPLPPLSLPAPDTGAREIARAEAVQLFVDRARLQQPEFAFAGGQAAVGIARLCTSLDGIPLALELAAALVGALSIEDINARLNDRFRLLTAGLRTAEPRQQTLRATLDWSYGLLTEAERVVLRRLAAFAGGFTIEAAGFVGCLSATDDVAEVDLLARLVARSLVVADTTDSGVRYRLLETTRAYALERLAEAGELAETERRHALYFCKRFESAHDDWLRLSSAEWRASYLPEIENVRAVLDWASSPRGDPALGFALASTTGPMWIELALRSEGRRRLEAGGGQVPSRSCTLEQARLSLWRGILWDEVAPTRSLALHERAVELYRTTGDAAGLGFALVQLAFTMVRAGQYERSSAVLAEADRALQGAAHPRALARYSETLGLLAELTRELGSAGVHFEKALSLFRQMGAERDVLRALGNLAEFKWALGDLDGAVSGYRDAVAVRRRSSVANKGMLGFALCNLAGVLIERGELDEALSCAREGLPSLRDLDLAWFIMDHFALRAALVGNTTAAAKLAGYLAAVFASKAPRGPCEARAHDRLAALLREKLNAQQLESLLAEGAQLSEEEACRMALER